MANFYRELVAILREHGCSLGVTFSSNISNELSPAQTGFWLLSLALWIWATVELGFLRGTPGPNRYGPDPRGAAEAAATT